MPLIIGLGNPGMKYKNTRHNVVFMILDEMAKSLDLTFSEKPDLNAFVAETNINGKKVVLAKPTTYMNNSGEAAQKIAQKYKFSSCDVWVVYDEATMPFGTLRIRLEGSAGGHNGVKSIISHSGAQDFVRFRIGIDEPPEEVTMDNWVLGRFSNEELKELTALKKTIAQRIIQSIKTNLQSVTENLRD